MQSIVQSNLAYPNVVYLKLLGFCEDDGQSRLFNLLFIAIKLLIFRISIFQKIHFFEEIHQSGLKKLLKLPFKIQSLNCQ